MKIYHNPRCSKSRQTLELLREHTDKIEIIEYLKDIPSENQLKEVLSFLDLKPQDVLRKGESIFKENFKGKEFTDDEWIKHMIEYPKLTERPIVIKDNKAVLGRPPENVKKLF